MTKDEALKLALEALVLNNAEWKHLADSGDSGDWSAEDQDHYKQTEEAITAIKEALAQPEPVGLIESLKDAKPCCGEYETCWRACTPRGKFLGQRDAQRTWVGLTDEEVDECYYWKDRLWTTDELVRHVEAKLKEKNT